MSAELDRSQLLADDDFAFEDEDEFSDDTRANTEPFLGMTPIERMFVSMFLFMNVAVLGIAILLATGRVGG